MHCKDIDECTIPTSCDSNVRTVKAALSALVTEAFSEMKKSVGKVNATIEDVLPAKNAFQRQVISVHAKEG